MRAESTTFMMRHHIRVTFYVKWRIEEALLFLQDQGPDAIY